MTRNESIIRFVVGGYFLFCAALSLVYPLESGVRAPLLALASGMTLATALFTLTRPGVKEWLSLIAAILGIAAAWFWLSQATNEDPVSMVMLVIAIPTIVLMFVWLGIVGWNEYQYKTKGSYYIGRGAYRNSVRQQLRRIVGQLRTTGTRLPGGDKYSRFDFELYSFFNNTWLILERPHSWTYAPIQHQDLLDTYIFRRLRRIAEIAITKHPYQCKYGEIAHDLSWESELLLQSVNIIVEFDPLPGRCPQCKEAKPKHRANCMAALCWRCKYPTPPSDRKGQGERVITTECIYSSNCEPRGELIQPDEEVVKRLSLPLGMPRQGDREEDLITLRWPTNKKELKELLKIHEH